MQVKKLGLIYRIKNLINHKCYIGLTSDFNRRKYEHLRQLRRGKHDNTHLQRSFIAYGENSFLFEIIENDIPISKLGEREKYWILELKPKYNIAPPGYTGMLGKKHTEETKVKIGDANRGNKYNLGRKLSEETRKKMSLSKMGRKNFGWRKHTDEARAKMSKSKSGIPSNRVRKVRQIDIKTNEVIKIWPSITEASKAVKISANSISLVALGKTHTAKGYKWEFAL